jgi:uncharacterized protein
MEDVVLREFIEQFLINSGDQALFSWQGGEPMMAGLEFYKKVLQYQSLFKRSGQVISNSIQTNGTLINDDWAKFFSKQGFLVGVSLDGPSAYHDKYRVDQNGNPSFKKVMRGIECLQKYNVAFNLLCLLNNINIEFPRELFQFFLNCGFNYLQFIPCVEVNTKTGEIEDFSITPDQYERFLCSIFDEWTKEKIPRIFVRDFEDILFSYVMEETPSCIYSGECGNYFVVEHNGDIYPCDFFVEREWLLGNLTEEPIISILNSRKFIDFKERKQKITKNCKDCCWFNKCHGGCTKNWGFSGVKRNYFCQSYQKFFQHSNGEFKRLKQIVERSQVTY